MATFRRVGKRWRAEVFRLGIRVSQSFDRKAEASAWAAATESEILSGTYGRQALDTLGDVLERYAAEVSPDKGGARWEKLRIEAFRRDALASLPIAEVTPELLGQWRDARLSHVSAGTVLREITLWTSVFEHARREWRLINVNSWRDVRKPRAPRHRERLISDDEIDRVTLALGYDGPPIETLSQQVAVMFLLAIETAMRSGEILSLRWDAVDMERRVARLTDTKNGDARDVPLSARAIELFRELREIDPIDVFTVTPASRDALFRKATQRAGCDDLHFHDSRAEACVRLSKRLDVLELARTIGHRDLKSLMIYYRATAADIAKKLG